MNDIRTRLAVAVGAGIAGAAVPALLFLGAGAAQAEPTNEEVGFGFVEKGIIIIGGQPSGGEEKGFIIVGGKPSGGEEVGIILHGKPAGNPDPGSRFGISDPEDNVGVGNPDTHPPVRTGVGNPTGQPTIKGFNPQPDPPGNQTADLGS